MRTENSSQSPSIHINAIVNTIDEKKRVVYHQMTMLAYLLTHSYGINMLVIPTIKVKNIEAGIETILARVKAIECPSGDQIGLMSHASEFVICCKSLILKVDSVNIKTSAIREDSKAIRRPSGEKTGSDLQLNHHHL
ncbi:MAG: hypothetical protein U0694_08930 [Anaerolineae bacterium]